MALDPFAALRSRVRNKRNPNAKLDGLKYAAAQARAPFDREVWLNVAFYLGRQYVDWDPTTLTLREIRRTSPREPRPVANKIMHFVAQSHAMALQDRPHVDVLPETDSPLDIGHTSLARAYTSYIAEPTVAGFSRRLSVATLWAIVGGEGFLKWIYNPRLGRPDILACSPLDIYVDPYATEFSSARYIIHSQFMDREQIYEAWGKEVKDDDAQLDPIKSDLMRQMGAAPVLSGVEVNEIWMRPSRRYPRGLYAVWTANDTLVEPTDFPYDHKRQPFTQIGMIPRPGSFHYMSPVSYLRSPQTELNNYHAQKIRNRMNFANPKWWVPTGLTLDSDPDDSPGQILRGEGPPNVRPELIQPTYMADNNDGDWIVREMQDIVGLHEVSQAQVPGRVEAAKAIEMLREADLGRLSVLHDTIKDSISEGFWQVLQLARQFVRDEVMVQVYGTEGLPEVKRFRSDVVRPGMRVRVTMGTGLARSRAARQDEILNLWDRGIINDPDRVAQLLDMPTPSFNEPNALDLKLARNENLELAGGTAVMPNSWDNHELHLQEHNNYRKTHEYLMLDQDAKNKFEHHCTVHEQLWVESMSRELFRLQLAQQIAMYKQGVPDAGQEQAPPAPPVQEPEPTQQEPQAEEGPDDPNALPIPAP